jgi:hypothetical protein
MTHYFLFGLAAVCAFNEGENTEIDISEGALFKFEDGEFPENLLHAYDGYTAYAVLTLEQFEAIEAFNKGTVSIHKTKGGYQIWDNMLNQVWANETFKTKAEAFDFVNQNNLILAK